MDRQNIEEKAVIAAESATNAIMTGNYVAVFAMLILQDLLIGLTNNPVTNLNSMIAVSGAIAGLNASIKPIQ
ncbi:hypothetical protein [Anaeroselena agilis]|uniref:Uncharacterized protein n=1 Tax=Anaeroselena agilis TaxID=3063788 RepID=A0ABU3NUA2_9FIRM|nr:hypothetical protein [Selenomonadales bacterium 4137-cl]